MQTTTDSITSIAGFLKESSDQLKNARTRIEMIAGKLADEMRQELAAGMDGITDNLSKRLDSVIAIFERSLAKQLVLCFRDSVVEAEIEETTWFSGRRQLRPVGGCKIKGREYPR